MARTPVPTMTVTRAASVRVNPRANRAAAGAGRLLSGGCDIPQVISDSQVPTSNCAVYTWWAIHAGSLHGSGGPGVRVSQAIRVGAAGYRTGRRSLNFPR